MPHNRRVSDEHRADDPDRARTGALPDRQLPTAGWAREGYAATEVDEFIEQLRQSLRREPPTMAPYEVEDERFTVTRLGRRYQPRAVDELLDVARDLLRERHGDDAVAHLAGRVPEPRHFPTLWIYAVALVLVTAMVLFLVTEL